MWVGAADVGLFSNYSQTPRPCCNPLMTSTASTFLPTEVEISHPLVSEDPESVKAESPEFVDRLSCKRGPRMQLGGGDAAATSENVVEMRRRLMISKGVVSPDELIIMLLGVSWQS
jgi:hypothetical protein